MRKKISFTTQSRKSYIRDGIMRGILPNRYKETIGPFFFFDHLLLFEKSPDDTITRNIADHSNSSKSIAILMYRLEDEAQCPASINASTSLISGQLAMNSGIQVIGKNGGMGLYEKLGFHQSLIRFCVNVPLKRRGKSLKYSPIEAGDISKQILSGNRGWLKLVVGEHENLVCKIKHFLYHFHLESGKQISTTTENGLEYAIFLPLHHAVINGIKFDPGEVIEFEKQEGNIEILNNNIDAIDILVFGGKPCT